MPDQTLQDIKDRLDIAELIGSYITIKKAGTSYKALCPFHNERTPSMQISPQKQIWHCFGCGEGGDIFGFVMKYENIEFKEALKILADRAGVKLPEYNSQNKQEVRKQEQLYKINDFAARFYHEILLKDKRGADAREYLKSRGLKPATISKWKIGFAPDEFHALEQALTKKKVPSQDLIEAGVSAKNNNGQMYDRFRGRITFPIFDSLGSIVGFSARILSQNSDPKRPLAKYINSPETLIYSKSKILFGFNFAKSSIRKQDEIIIVEGQMDCISAEQAGFTNVVASSGTALTPDQLTQVSRLTKNLKFCFDADQAGLLATKRAVANYLGKDFVIKIVSFNIPGIKDPDDLIKKDPKQFAQQVQNAPLFLDYYIEQSFKNFKGSVTEKKTIAKELLPLIKILTDPIEQQHYIQLLAKKLQTTTDALSQSISSIKLAPTPAAKPLPNEPNHNMQDKVGVLEKEVLGGMMLYPNFVKFVSPYIQAQDFPSPSARQLFLDLQGNNEQLARQKPLAQECIFMVESQLADSNGNEQFLFKELQKFFALLKLPAAKIQLKNLSDQIKQAEQSGIKQEVLKLNQEFVKLSSIRLELEKFLY